MSWFMVDVETDGPCPGLFSMIDIGVVLIDDGGNLDITFRSELKPMTNRWEDDALKVSNRTREQTMLYPDPRAVMERLRKWIADVNIGKRAFFISDNNGFDWGFVNYYFHHFIGANPFGHSSTNLGSLYKGIIRDSTKNFKHLRITKHTHNPLDDARGNAEALLHMRKEMGLVFPL